MLPRLVCASLVSVAILGEPESAVAGSQLQPKERPASRQSPEQWVAMVVTKVSRSGQEAFQDLPSSISRNSRAAIAEGTVTIRVRIGADGTLEGAKIEESSGSDALDRRALQAAKAAAPFKPPPANLLTLEGFTELAFAVEFAR